MVSAGDRYPASKNGLEIMEQTREALRREPTRSACTPTTICFRAELVGRHTSPPASCYSDTRNSKVPCGTWIAVDDGLEMAEQTEV
jgi:hypothetical protein